MMPQPSLVFTVKQKANDFLFAFRVLKFELAQYRQCSGLFHQTPIKAAPMTPAESPS